MRRSVGLLALSVALCGCERTPSDAAATKADGGGAHLDAVAVEQNDGALLVIDLGVVTPPDSGPPDGPAADAGATDAAGPADALDPEDAGAAADADASPPPDASTLDATLAPSVFSPWTPPPMTRGRAWVREHPMVIAALSVVAGPPPAAAVDTYFDAFHASATYLWATGLPVEMDGWAARGHPAFRWIAWVSNDGTSLANGQFLGGYPAAAPGRIGYQVGDEPGVGGGPGMPDLLQMAQGIEAVRTYDPTALAWVNFARGIPDIDAMMDHYFTHAIGDVVMYDNYGRGNGQYSDLEYFRARALPHGVPYWRWLKSYYDTNSNDPELSDSDLRWFAFSGLLYGYTGHVWFVYTIGPQDPSSPLSIALFEGPGFEAPRTPVWHHIAAINTELANLGRAVTQLTSTDVRYIPGIVLSMPDDVTRWSPGAGDDPFIVGIEPVGTRFIDLSVGFFRDDAGEIYVMLQNLHHTNANFPNASDASATVRVRFDFGAAPPVLDRARLWTLNRTSGAVEALPLAREAQGTWKLELELAAGDPVLFKYATDRPFALQ